MNISMRQESTMVNPCMTKERIMELFYDFADYVSGKKEIPEKYLKNDPSRRFADSDEIYELYEKYKQGPIDPVLIVPKESIKEKQLEETIRR